MNQKRKVLNHLLKYGHITRKEAYGIYGITRLAARIKELEDDGIRFIREFLGKKKADYKYTVRTDQLEDMRKAKVAKEYMRDHGFTLIPMCGARTMSEVRV